MESVRRDVRVTMLVERLDDSWRTRHGMAQAAIHDNQGIAQVVWDDGGESKEWWSDLRPEPLRIGDRVVCIDTNDEGTITHSSHGVEYMIEWSSGDSSMHTNREIKRAPKAAEGDTRAWSDGLMGDVD